MAMANSLDISRYTSLAWNMEEYYKVIKTIYKMKQQVNKNAMSLVVNDIYDRGSGEKTGSKSITISHSDIIIIEGTSAIDKTSLQFFDLAIRLDVEPSRVLLERVVTREAEKHTNTIPAMNLEKRFNLIDLPHLKYSRQFTLENHYAFVVDNSNFDRIVLYQNFC